MSSSGSSDSESSASDSFESASAIPQEPPASSAAPPSPAAAAADATEGAAAAAAAAAPPAQTLKQVMQGLEDSGTPSAYGASPAGGFGTQPPSSSTGTPDAFAPISSSSGSEDEDEDDDDDDDDEEGGGERGGGGGGGTGRSEGEGAAGAPGKGPRVKRKEKAKRVSMEVEAAGAGSGAERVGPGASAKRIRELNKVDEQIAKLLSLASEVVGALSPPPPSEDSQAPPPLDVFTTSINSYFSTLNETHLALRTSVSHLKSARISQRILLQPGHAPGGGERVRSGAAEGASLEALSLERDAWADVLKGLRGLQQPGEAREA